MPVPRLELTSTCRVVMNSNRTVDRTVEAVFKLDVPTVRLNVSAFGSGGRRLALAPPA